MKAKEVILYEDQAAAKLVNVTGWVDKNGRFFGNQIDSEHLARYSGCTHKTCECGELIEKMFTKCSKCRELAKIQRHKDRKFQEWDGEEIVYSDKYQRYFYDADEIVEFCDDEEIDPSELRLLLCIPQYFNQIDEDYWSDVLPEDSDGELPNKLIEALVAFNEVIKSLPPVSYIPSEVRTEYK